MNVPGILIIDNDERSGRTVVEFKRNGTIFLSDVVIKHNAFTCDDLRPVNKFSTDCC